MIIKRKESEVIFTCEHDIFGVNVRKVGSWVDEGGFVGKHNLVSV